MKKKIDLSNDELVHLAKLANLHLTESEIKTFAKQLAETIEYVENLEEVDTENIKLTSSTVNTANVYFEDGKKSERTLTQEEALLNAKNKKDSYFVVKQIL